MNQFRAFGECGYVPLLYDIKTKSVPRSILVRYLSAPRTGIFRVLDPKIGRLFTCRAVDYRPYNPAYDPQRYIAHALPLQEGLKRRVNLHHVIPSMASAVTTHATSTSTLPELPMASSLPPPPKSLMAARRHLFAKQWRQSYAEEVELLTVFGTFNMVDRRTLPRNDFVPRAQIRFTYKENDIYEVVGFKARIVYPGNRLVDGVHYDSKETSTYSADRDSLRFLIALASQRGYQLFHIDLKSAFLHERFKDKTPLYLQALTNFDGSPEDKNLAYMLAANLYGTPQACRVYIQGAYDHLRAHGYHQCKSDQNIFTKRQPEDVISMALTIDDFLIAASSAAVYRRLLHVLSLKYRTKDLGHATRILNWTLRRPPSCPTEYHLTQPHKIQQFVDLVGMSASNPVQSPQAIGHLLYARLQGEAPLSLQHPSAPALGILRYIADCTRPDVTFITGLLARHSKDPSMRHWKALQYIGHYLKGSKNVGLHYRGVNTTLQAYADSDFAGCTDTRQSTHGNVLYYAGTPISWCSRRIKTVVISSCAAEYISNSKTGEHIVWLRSLVSEVLQKALPSTLLHNDNSAAETIAKSRGQTKKSKYIEVRWHHIKDLITRRLMDIVHIPCKTLVADVLTKFLYVTQFQFHRKQLKLTPWTTPQP